MWCGRGGRRARLRARRAAEDRRGSAPPVARVGTTGRPGPRRARPPPVPRAAGRAPRRTRASRLRRGAPCRAAAAPPPGARRPRPRR